MEWYFGNGADELLVPREREASDRWMQWGIIGAESFDTPNKYFVTDTKSAGEIDFNHKSFSDVVDMDFFSHERDQSSSSNVCGGLSEAPNLRTRIPRDQSDYQFDNLAGTDQMDEIFLNSLLEEDQPGGDATLGSESVMSNFHSMENSRYLKKNAFSPAVGWENNEIDTSHYVPFNLGKKDFPSVKAPLEKVSDTSEQNSIDEHVGDEQSLEESVLHELETVMEQMTDSTRLCFRDALYRLAKNSKQHMIIESQDGNLALERALQTEVHGDTLRSGREKVSESETNTIDRTVANLMFSNMDFNKEDHTAALMDFGQGTISMIETSNYSLNQPEMPHFPLPTRLQGDAEVPIFAQLIAE